MLTTLVALAVTLVATPAARAIAMRTGWLDIPNTRSSHAVPTPRAGGLAIAVGAAASIAITVPLDAQMRWMLAGTVGMTVMGAVDDIRALSPVLRLVAQFGAAALVIGVAGASLPPAGLAWTAVLTAIWIVGTTNAYNFMDGIDGIAGCQAVIAAAALAVLADRHGDLVSVGVVAALGGAAAGFLPWNLPRASIFMGDAGSATLGFAFATVVTRISMTRASFVAAALPLAPFLLDASATLVRRIVRGEPLLRAHRSHFYQRMVALGYSHVSTTGLWSALALASAAGAVVYDLAAPAARWCILTGVVLLHAAVAGFIITAESRRTAGTPSRVREAK